MVHPVGMRGIFYGTPVGMGGTLWVYTRYGRVVGIPPWVYARYTMVGICLPLPCPVLYIPGYTLYIPDAPRCVHDVGAVRGV